MLPRGENIPITPEELQQIRALDDFDLTMLLSEIHDSGWDNSRYGGNTGARKLLPFILAAIEAKATREPKP